MKTTTRKITTKASKLALGRRTKKRSSAIKSKKEKSTFSQFLSKKRKEANISQATLANYLGLTTQAVFNWEADRSVPRLPPTGVQRLCYAIGTDFDTLCREYENSHPYED